MTDKEVLERLEKSPLKIFQEKLKTELQSKEDPKAHLGSVEKEPSK